MSYFVIVFNIVYSLVFIPLIIRNIGESQYAVYGLILSLVSLFSLDFGIGEVVSRYVAEYRIGNENDKYDKFIIGTFNIFILIAIIVLIALLIVYFNLDRIYTKLTLDEISHLKNVFIVLIVYIVVNIALSPCNGILIGSENFLVLRFIELFNRIILILLTLVTLILEGGVEWLVYTYIISGSTAILIKITYIIYKKYIKIHLDWADLNTYKEIFSMSLWTSFTSVIQRIVFYLFPSILGILSGSYEIALFSIALSIEGYIWTISNALNGLFMPTIMKHRINNDKKSTNNLLLIIGKAQLALMGLIITGFLILGDDFIYLWLGDSFTHASKVAFYLVAHGYITFSLGVAYSYMIVEKKIKYYSISLIVSSTISLTISFILIPLYGALGASITIFIGNVIGQVILMSWFYQNRMKLDMNNFYKNIHLKYLVPLVITLFAGIVINIIFEETNLIFFLIKILTITIVYLIAIVIFFVNETERKYLWKFLLGEKNGK